MYDDIVTSKILIHVVLHVSKHYFIEFVKKYKALQQRPTKSLHNIIYKF